MKKRKPRDKDYWPDWENLYRELAPIIEQEGGFPTEPRLKELGRKHQNGFAETRAVF